MKRYMLWSLFALAAVALALLPSPAPAAEEQPFAAVFSPQSVTHDGKYYVYDVAGNGSHVGDFSAVANNHFFGWDRLAGFMTITAPSGDELWIDYKQTLTVDENTATGTWTGSYTITGGTGRFAGASGQGDCVVTIPLGGPATGTFDGTIRF